MGKGANPLDVSPANVEVSRVNDVAREGLTSDSASSRGASKGGSPTKGAVGKKYEKESELRQHSETRGNRL